MSKVTETVTALAAPVAAELGLELWDVEYVREAGQWYLRIFMGSGAEVRLYKPLNGSKSFVGTLSGYSDGDVTLTVAGKELTFEKARIAQVRLRVL